jgi:hypothetical protein
MEKSVPATVLPAGPIFWISAFSGGTTFVFPSLSIDFSFYLTGDACNRLVNF